jgi:hypothetical protein
VFTKLLPGNERRHTHTDTQTDGKDLCSTPFLDMYHSKFQKLWSNLIEFRRFEYEDTEQQHPIADTVMERVHGVLTAIARLEGRTPASLGKVRNGL